MEVLASVLGIVVGALIATVAVGFFLWAGMWVLASAISLAIGGQWPLD